MRPSRRAALNAAGRRPDRTWFRSRFAKESRRPGHNAFLAAGLSVAVIGVACAVIYPIVRKELEQARRARAAQAATTGTAGEKPAEAAKPASAEPRDPSERCELRVFRAQPGGEAIVVLTQPGKMTEFRRNYYGTFGRLFRELVRQAVLLAARDGLESAGARRRRRRPAADGPARGDH